MGAFFTIGSTKKRPGVYFRYEDYGTPLIAGADDGKCAAVFQSNSGPVDKVVVLESYNDAIKVFGDGKEDGAEMVLEQFNGGARKVYAYAVRLVGDGEAYGAAFEALEAYRWNVLSIDTTDSDIQSAMQNYLNRVYNDGKFVMGVIGGEKTSENDSFETRCGDASTHGDYQIVYVGTGFVDAKGNEYEGALAAARVAGLIAGTPSNQSITHMAVKGAVDLTEPLTNGQYEHAIEKGMLTFSTSSAGTVWVEQGINTLTEPGTDPGWQKIKRVKVRFELMQRLNDTVEGLVGRVNNDPDGRMTIIQCANAVCNQMVAEHKLLAGAHCEIDPDNAPNGDSAWFLILADDIDALEKMYFTFKFRFAPDNQTA